MKRKQNDYLADKAARQQPKAVAVALPEEQKKESWLLWPLKGLVLVAAVIAALVLNLLQLIS